jgi:hypothetical protein
LVQEKEVKHKKVLISILLNQNLIEVKDDNYLMIKDTKIKKPATAMETFMSLPDDLLIEMIHKDPEGVNVICMALGIELSGVKSIRDLES